MREVRLSKGEYYYVDEEFFLILHGKVRERYILIDGRTIGEEICLVKDEMVGNFFKFLDINSIFEDDSVGVEIEALEETVLITDKEFEKIITGEDMPLKLIIRQLIKKLAMKFLSKVYDKERYMLILLKLWADTKDLVYKKEIGYEVFNMSKSNYYLIYTKLKEKNFFEDDKEGHLKLNIPKIDKYIEESFVDIY